MEYGHVPNLRSYLDEWTEEIDLFRQNRLMDESQFLSFSRDRGLPVSGVITGDPGNFFKRDWLDADATDSNMKPRFHPFRVYPLHRILRACDLGIALSASLNPDSALRMTERALKRMPPVDQLLQQSRDWNNVATLAVIVEPIYWPGIVGSHRLVAGMTEHERQSRYESFRARVRGLIQSLDPGLWQNMHENLRIDAARIDDNPYLYVLLRVANWDGRKRLRGRISGALWLRHMAEAIRRAFEEVHKIRWPEEYEAFGYWPAGAREIDFGSERPLDSILAAKPYLAHSFGLFTGSVVRRYVEGLTEYFAVLEILGDVSKFGIELVDLKGSIASGKDNTPLKVEALLKEDCSLRRFSIISFDRDVPENVKFIRRQVEQENFVGLIAANDPDYEFANFSLQELVEVAASIDEDSGFPGDPVRQASWSGITSSKAFEERYRSVSARRPDKLKGEKWGRALARYAIEHPSREGGTRPFLQEMRAAVHSWSSDYDYQHDHFTFDRQTFEQIPRTRKDRL